MEIARSGVMDCESLSAQRGVHYAALECVCPACAVSVRYRLSGEGSEPVKLESSEMHHGGFGDTGRSSHFNWLVVARGRHGR